MTKDWKQFLVSRGRKFTKKKLEAPKVQSPLLTNFHQWAGKKRLFEFNDSDEVSKVLGNESWGVSKNLFANILASPMRTDMSKRIKLPRELLIQIKLEPIKNDTNEGKLVALRPQLEISKGGNNSYICNSLRFLQGKRASLGQLVPNSVHSSNTCTLNMNEILMDKRLFTEKYQQDLSECITTLLESLCERTDKENAPVTVEDWDVILTYDEKNNNDIELVKLKHLPSVPTVIILNLKLLDNDSIGRLINDKLRNHDIGVVLKFLKDERLIKLVYSLLNFSR